MSTAPAADPSGPTDEPVDYVVVGSGAAGAVVAARLTEDPAIRVLLLEAGPRRRSPLLAVPAAEVLLMGDDRYDWCFRTEPDPTAGGRSLAIPRGRVLGGSNAINGMVFVRGQREDYDDWAAGGAAGWGWDDVLPYFRRLEQAAGFGGPARGHDGPLTVSVPAHLDPVSAAFLRAADACGHPRNADYNDGDQEGFGLYQSTVRRGVRSSVLGGYLDAARRRPNLVVRTGAHAERLVLAGSTCTGVEYRHGGTRRTATATREVVVCAGTIGSPQLLELSGIGAPGVLAAAGLPLRHALPGVGEHFRDHFAIRAKWRVGVRTTLNDTTRGWRLGRELARWALRGRGSLAGPIATVFGFLRSSPDEARADLQIHMTPGSYGPSSTRRFDHRPGMTVGVYPLRPESEGSVHVVGPDPADPPAIRPRFLDAEADRRRLVAGVRRARELIAAPPMAPVCEDELVPGVEVADDDALLRWVREHGDTSYHPVGTCRAGSGDDTVVDPRLRVRGLRGLRVVDASVMPSMVSGNTNAAALMIGEKGAAMIAEDRARESVVAGRGVPGSGATA